MNPDDKINVLTVERAVKFEISKVFPADTPIDVSIIKDDFARSFIIDVKLLLFGKDKEFSHTTEQPTYTRTKQFPRTWIDAFKERFFPKWLLCKFPCAYETIIIYERHITNHYVTRVCPHLQSTSDIKHVQWIDGVEKTEGGLPPTRKCSRCGGTMEISNVIADKHVIYECKRCMYLEKANK